MKSIVCLTVVLFNLTAFSQVRLSVKWESDYKKYLTLKCGEKNRVCRNICKANICKIEEKECFNCVGTSIFMTNLFQELGRTITSNLSSYYTKGKIYEAIEGNKIFMTSKSIYNIYSKYNSRKVQRQFSKLCRTKSVEDPILVIDVFEGTNEPYQPSFVICQDKEGYKVHEMQVDSDIEVRRNSVF